MREINKGERKKKKKEGKISEKKFKKGNVPNRHVTSW
jgi:hypothetical protein